MCHLSPKWSRLQGLEVEDGDPQAVTNSAALPLSPRPGSLRGQDGAAAVTKLLSRVHLHLSKAPSLWGLPPFSPVLPPSVLLSFEKDEMGGGTRGCKMPQIRLEAGAGGRKDSGERAVSRCFPFFGATQFTAACLPSGSRAPELRVLRASLPYLKGFPTPILQLDY